MEIMQYTWVIRFSSDKGLWRVPINYFKSCIDCFLFSSTMPDHFYCLQSILLFLSENMTTTIQEQSTGVKVLYNKRYPLLHFSTLIKQKWGNVFYPTNKIPCTKPDMSRSWPLHYFKGTTLKQSLISVQTNLPVSQRRLNVSRRHGKCRQTFKT